MQAIRHILSLAAALSIALGAWAQDSNQQSSSSVLRRGSSRTAKQQTVTPGVTQRMQMRLADSATDEGDLQWMRVIYRSLDLTDEKNAALYYPEEPIEGQESLFRLIMRLLANDQLPAYEYLDGREVFNDTYRLKVRDVLDRFHVYYKEAKGSSEKHPRFTIEDSDVPANEVLSYYIIERWEFDKRTNRKRTRVEAICPVLHRSDDFGMESVKYPMFWIKYSDLRPYLTSQTTFTSDANNLATCTFDDFFQLGLYDGEIYKTRNLRNRSMTQLYPDPEAMKRAQDSIQQSLDNFDKSLWVPSHKELLAARTAREEAEAAKLAAAEGNDSTTVAAAAPKANTRVASKRGQRSDSRKPAKVKQAKMKQPKAKTSSTATRSVRNRRR